MKLIKGLALAETELLQVGATPEICRRFNDEVPAADFCLNELGMVPGAPESVASPVGLRSADLPNLRVAPAEEIGAQNPQRAGLDFASRDHCVQVLQIPL